MKTDVNKTHLSLHINVLTFLFDDPEKWEQMAILVIPDSQSAFTRSKLTIETLGQGVKYVQS